MDPVIPISQRIPPEKYNELDDRFSGNYNEIELIFTEVINAQDASTTLVCLKPDKNTAQFVFRIKIPREKQTLKNVRTLIEHIWLVNNKTKREITRLNISTHDDLENPLDRAHHPERNFKKITEGFTDSYLLDFPTGSLKTLQVFDLYLYKSSWSILRNKIKKIPNLENLKLEYLRLDDTDVLKINTSLQSSMKRLNSLSLRGNNITARKIPEIIDWKNWKQIDLSHQYSGWTKPRLGQERETRDVEISSTVNQLNLSGVEMTDELFDFLIKKLENGKFEVLRLSDTNISPEHFIVITETLRQARKNENWWDPQLRVLDLSNNNNIRAAVLNSLLKMLKDNRTIQEINLEGIPSDSFDQDNLRELKSVFVMNRALRTLILPNPRADQEVEFMATCDWIAETRPDLDLKIGNLEHRSQEAKKNYETHLKRLHELLENIEDSPQRGEIIQEIGEIIRYHVPPHAAIPDKKNVIPSEINELTKTSLQTSSLEHAQIEKPASSAETAGANME